MKHYPSDYVPYTRIIRSLTLLALLAALSPQLSAGPLGTAFTYQGKLNDGPSPATGLYDFSFSAWDASSGGNAFGPTLSMPAVTVTNGLFTVTLDFGSIFIGTALWLDISVKTNGAATYATLTPRQLLTPVPNAIYSSSAASAVSANVALSASVAGGVTPGAVGAAGIASGQVVKSLNALRDDVQLAPGANLTLTPSGQTLTLASPDDWHLAGNSGTTPGVNFLGTIDNQPLQLKVNSILAFRLEPNASGPNVIGGGPGNSVGTYGGFIGGGNNNQIQSGAYYSAIGGGLLNLIQSNAYYTTIAGGLNNQVQGLANGNASLFGFIGGGQNNVIEPYGWNSTIGGGYANRIQYDGDGATIGGGDSNVIGTNADYTVIGGGYGNVISNAATFATIPGGYQNVAGASYAFAAGRQAKANHQGAFVWSDSQSADFASTANNQFLIRASGNVGINKNNPGTALDVNGTVTATGFAGPGAGLTGVIPADNSVNATKIVDGSVGTLELADGSVTSLKIADNTVAAVDLASDVASLSKVSGGRMAVSGNRVILPDFGAIDTTSFTGLGFQYQGSSGEGAIMSSFNDGYGYLSFYTKQGFGLPITKRMIIDTYGGVAIDQSDANNGVFNHSSAAGVGLAFGVGSGEGVASKRTATGNQYGLDFYTGFLPRLSIANGGNVGIGTTAPAVPLDVTSTRSISSTSDGIVNIGTQTGIHITMDGDVIQGKSGANNSTLWLNYYGGDVYIGQELWVDYDQNRVGIGTTSPTAKLHVAGTAGTDGIKFPDGTLQTTAPKPVFSNGYGNDPWNTNRFVAPSVTVTVTSSSQQILVTSNKALGSVPGASSMNLYIGYRAVGSTAAPNTVGGGIFGNKVAANTRVIMGMSGVITGLAPGSYDVGLVGISTDYVNWNSNEWGYTTAVVY